MSLEQITAVGHLPLDTVYLKVLDESTPGLRWDWQLQSEAMRLWRKAGKKIVGWGFHNGTASLAEFSSALRGLLQLGLESYIFDVEEQVTLTNFDAVLSQIKITSALMESSRLAITSHDFPNSHQAIPYGAISKYVNTVFPQCYFMVPNTVAPEGSVDVSVFQYRQFFKNIYPVFNSFGDDSTPVNGATLKRLMREWPSSSVFRAPHSGEDEFSLSDMLWC